MRVKQKARLDAHSFQETWKSALNRLTVAHVAHVYLKTAKKKYLV